MEKLSIPVILGTAREGRRSEAPAKYLLDLLKKRSAESQLVDPKDYPVDIAVINNNLPDRLKPWQEIAKKADGFVIVSPEYNHGYPGALKNLLDVLYAEFNYKPVGICGVSAGVLGGARAVEQLRLVAIELKMIPIRSAVYFGSAKNLNLMDYTDKINKLLDELLWLAEVMKDARTKRLQKPG